MDATDNRLRLLVERVERIDEEIAGLRQDRADVIAEAKAVGYDAGTFRKVIARRKMKPDDRAEADLLLETYEAALGGHGPDPARDPSEAAAELATALLAEQLDGIADPAQSAALVEHVTVLLDLRAEIAALRQLEAARVKLAKGEGFLAAQLKATIRWIEKCAKHGAEAMRAGEAVFHLYRGTVDRRGVGGASSSEAIGGHNYAPVSADPKLQQTFGRGTAAKDKAMAATMAWLNSGLGD